MPTVRENKALVVIPALNEQDSIRNVIEQVRTHNPKFDILVVDDGSTDATAAIASALGAMILSLPFNLGVGGAMRLGFRFALERHYQVVVQIDADGQHDPADVNALISALGPADVVIGSRFAGRGFYKVSGPRKWAMWLLARILSRLTRSTLSDTTSGFKAHGDQAIRLFAHHYPAEYLGDTVEAIVLGSKAGLSFTEVPVEMRARTAGTPSQNAFRSALYLGRTLVALLIALLRPSVAEKQGQKK